MTVDEESLSSAALAINGCAIAAEDTSKALLARKSARDVGCCGGCRDAGRDGGCRAKTWQRLDSDNAPPTRKDVTVNVRLIIKFLSRGTRGSGHPSIRSVGSSPHNHLHRHDGSVEPVRDWQVRTTGSVHSHFMPK